MATFGLITEGITDQKVISNILAGYYQDPNISIRPFQPLLDATDEDKQGSPGNWNQIFKYCKSDKLAESFNHVDYVVIQIDTDVSEEKGFDVPKKWDGKDLSPEDLIKRVKERIVSDIDTNLYKLVKDRIIFAIAVHSTECWLLPIYANTKAHKTKTENCLGTLNDYLNRKIKYTIDPKNKDSRKYHEFSKPYLKNKKLLECSKDNPSLGIFIYNLPKPVQPVQSPIETF